MEKEIKFSLLSSSGEGMYETSGILVSHQNALTSAPQLPPIELLSSSLSSLSLSLFLLALCIVNNVEVDLQDCLLIAPWRVDGIF